MTHPNMDQDIDLDLDDDQPARYVRPAQPYVIASRIALGIGALIVLAGWFAAGQGWLDIRSRLLPLMLAVVVVCGIIGGFLNERADDIDAPAILIDDQEV